MRSFAGVYVHIKHLKLKLLKLSRMQTATIYNYTLPSSSVALHVPLRGFVIAKQLRYTVEKRRAPRANQIEIKMRPAGQTTKNNLPRNSLTQCGLHEGKISEMHFVFSNYCTWGRACRIFAVAPEKERERTVSPTHPDSRK